jgi:hypothetical protein
MTLTDELIAFIRRHGTAKLKECDDALLRRYLNVPHLVSVWVPGEALGLGWFTTNGAFYVANLMAASPRGLRRLLRQFDDRFPWVTRFEGNRVPAPFRRTRQAILHNGRACKYGRDTMLRLQRFTEHRAALAEPREQQLAFA